MRKFLTFFPIAFFVLSLIFPGCSGSSSDSKGDTEQPAIQVGDGTGKTIINVDGLQFKDLSGDGELDPYEDWRLSASERAADLLSQMSAEQKIGLMSETSYLSTIADDGSYTATAQANIVTGHVRQGLVRLTSVDGNNDATMPKAQILAIFLNNIQKLCETQSLGIPFIVTTDPSHGIESSTNTSTMLSMWPMPLGLGAINDTALTQKFGKIVRKEFMAMGLRWELGPMCDVASEPRWQRVQNTFGAVVNNVSAHSAAIIKGFQAEGEGGLKKGIAATMKHFPGAGPNEDGMDSHTTSGRFNVYPGNNFSVHLEPFQAAIDAGVASVMPCYSIFVNNPWGTAGSTDYASFPFASSYSPGIVTELLKEDMGFDGMVTSDWGILSRCWGIDQLSTVPTESERIKLYLDAGGHQLGQDSYTKIITAYGSGEITDADLDKAAQKILEMSFKMGIFENPYVDADAAATTVRSEEYATAGFEAQKKAMVLLRNQEHSLAGGGDKYLPISGSRKNASNEYVCDTNENGSVEVWYDGIADGLVLTGSDVMSGYLGVYDYTSAGGSSSIPVVAADSLATADIAVIRITARPGIYMGLDAGIPLSFDRVFPGTSADSTLAIGQAARNKIIDALRVRDGYTDFTGNPVAATNPTLKIVVVMYMTRPGIIEPFVKGLTSLDETLGTAGSYPLVSDSANIRADGLGGIDGILVDFGAIDRAVLDVVFNANRISSYAYGTARLPMEIPSSDAAVDAQYEDMPSDSVNPTYSVGAGMTY